MREMRIMLPDDLWEKFTNFSPQKMKDIIRTTICMHYGIFPEKRKRKKPCPANSLGIALRDDKGKFISPVAGQSVHAGKATNTSVTIGNQNIEKCAVELPVVEMPAAEHSTAGVSRVPTAASVVAPEQPSLEPQKRVAEDRQYIQPEPAMQITIPTHKKIKMNAQYLTAL